MKRKKRLEKGIESLQEQIDIHLEKREQAVEEGNMERVSYYDKEIKTLEKDKKKKEDYLEKE